MEDHFKRNLSKWEDKAPSVQYDVAPGAFDRPGGISYFCITESGIGVYMENFYLKKLFKKSEYNCFTMLC